MGTQFGPGIVLDSKILVQLVLVKIDETNEEVAIPVEELMDPALVLPSVLVVGSFLDLFDFRAAQRIVQCRRRFLLGRGRHLARLGAGLRVHQLFDRDRDFLIGLVDLDQHELNENLRIDDETRSELREMRSLNRAAAVS